MKKEKQKKATAKESAKEEKAPEIPKSMDEPTAKAASGKAGKSKKIMAGSELPPLRSGDEVKVFYKVREGGKERVQLYEGTIIAIKNTGISRTITVRKTSYGIAVERIFPLQSKLLQKIELKRHTKVRRAKLYYLRKLKGKLSRLKELRQ